MPVLLFGCAFSLNIHLPLALIPAGSILLCSTHLFPFTSFSALKHTQTHTNAKSHRSQSFTFECVRCSLFSIRLSFSSFSSANWSSNSLVGYWFDSATVLLRSYICFILLFVRLFPPFGVNNNADEKSMLRSVFRVCLRDLMLFFWSALTNTLCLMLTRSSAV